MFTEKDLTQITGLGQTKEKVLEQIEIFERGLSPAQLVRPATINDGIRVFSESELSELSEYYTSNKQTKKIYKFVPASGAATRMFKSYFEYLGSDKNTPEGPIKEFIESIQKFAFVSDLDDKLKPTSINSLIASGDYKEIVSALLNDNGLDYGNLPKGLIQFHKYSDKSRTSFEEHLVEGALHAVDDNGNVNIHFTISEEHQTKFSDLYKIIKPQIEEKYGVKLNVTFSYQLKSTDTIAVTLENGPFREQDGSLLFRPGGHGALLHNLNNLDADLVFIKNIDNIIPDRLREPTILYKKVFAGYILKLQEQVFSYLEVLENGNVSDSIADEIIEFIYKHFFINPKQWDETGDLSKKLFDFLNKPMRVCGMIKNEGDVGGGPFWINLEGKDSLQIVESAQVDLSDDKQKQVFNKATHFNPVDIVCGLKNYKGEKFDLLQYFDPNAAFISKKSKDGKDLKALELPGLWNGSMAHWLTVFVEVPLVTFNPVKTLNDLLKENHQA